MKQLLSILLAALMLIPCFISCAEKTDGATDNDATSAVTEAETEPVTTKLESGVPSDTKFNDETVRILHFGNDTTINYDTVGELSGDVVMDAVYSRNIKTSDQLGVVFEWNAGSNDWGGFPDQVKKSIASGSDDFDLAFMESSQCFRLSLDGNFYNLAAAPYIDFDMPWWYTEFMNDACINPAQRYFVTGAFSLSTMLYASSVYFNKGIYENFYGDPNDLYQLVSDGGWTYDKLLDYCRGVYTDVNGDQTVDEEDTVGFYNDGQRTVNYTSMSTGLTYITRDEEGVPQLDIYNDDVLLWVEKLYDFCFEEGLSLDRSGKIEGSTAFMNEKALFYFMMLSSTTQIRESEFAWGIMPYPVLREGLEYKSAAGTVNGNSAVFPVTASTEKMDMCCAVLELLSYYAYYDVVPAWYEIALKSKYSDTEMDSAMVDIIYDSIYSPFIMVIDKHLNLGSFFTTCVYASKIDEGQYSSYYEKNSKSYLKSWDNMITKYNTMVETNG